MEVHKINFVGPLSWMANKVDESILYSEVAKKRGVYVWTVKTAKGYMIWYAGETIWNFSTRMGQHLEKQLSGQYHFYDPEAFAQGRKDSIWPGMFGNKSNMKPIAEYINKLEESLPKYIEFIRSTYFFVAPSQLPKRLLQRIEAAITLHLRNQGGEVGYMIDRFAIRPRRPDEEPVNVIIQYPPDLIGIPEELVV